MSTRSCVIIKVRPEDIGKVMKFNNELLPVKEEDWGDEADMDKAEDVKISSAYLGVYCHWDGYPDGVGAALKANFNTYEQALNLILGGSYSSISNDSVRRYATRSGEDWDTPIQSDDLMKVVDSFDWSEYAYRFTEEKGWMVKDIYKGRGFRSF